MAVVSLMTGRLEPTSSPYAVAKLAGLTLCQVSRRALLRSEPTGRLPRKSLDSTRLAELGWAPATPLRGGLAATYEWFRTTRGAAETVTAAAR